MVQTISADGSDNAFTKRILPWRARRRNNFLDTQALDPSSNLLTVNGISIAQQITWSGIEWKCFYQLLGRPPCGGMRCNIEVHDMTAVMAEHDKHIENAKCGDRDREEINPRYTVDMVFDSSNANKNESPVDASARRYRGAMRATLTAILLHISRTGPKTGGRQEIPADASPMVLALRVAVGALDSPASIDGVT